MLFNHRARFILIVFASALFVAAATFWFFVRHSVAAVMSADGRTIRPLSFVTLPPTPSPPPSPHSPKVEWLGGGEVIAVAASADSLWTAGSFGVINESGVQTGLPSLKASAMLLWRGRPLIALETGGLYLRNGHQWEEVRTGFGTLHTRCLLEGVGGELYIGAKEGIFQTQWGANTIERLHQIPVRSIAIGAGTVLAGGEDGLVCLSGGRASAVSTPDRWIDWIGIRGDQIVLLTAQGLASGSLDGEIQPLRLNLQESQGISGAVQFGDSIFVVGEQSLIKMDANGRFSQEYLPQTPRRLFVSGGLLFADTDVGLFKKNPHGWTLARRRPDALPPGSIHVTALAHFQNQLAVGTFDGGIIIGVWDKNGTSAWRTLPIANAWGINAMLPFSGSLTVASLRGALRVEGNKIIPLNPSGASFSLAQTQQGMAIGYGHGVLLPGGEFLSAFHGLPGNQALAMLQDDYLYVGTPSGLGAISGSKVAWRTVAGDGLLPHPWITSLVSFKNAVYIGTYGGGVTRRIREGDPPKGGFRHFFETDGLKVNVGCMVVFNGSLFAGTDGKGLYRLSMDGTRFEQMILPIPSNNVTALLPDGDSLLVGTTEGIARLPLSILLQEGR
jgi:hypothetical protein